MMKIKKQQHKLEHGFRYLLTVMRKQTCYEKFTILYTGYIILHKIDTFSSPLHKLLFIKIYNRKNSERDERK